MGKNLRCRRKPLDNQLLLTLNPSYEEIVTTLNP